LRGKFFLHQLHGDGKCSGDILHIEHFVRCNILLQIISSNFVEELGVLEEIVKRKVLLDLVEGLLEGLEPSVQEIVEHFRRLRETLKQTQH